MYLQLTAGEGSDGDGRHTGGRGTPWERRVGGGAGDIR